MPIDEGQLINPVDSAALVRRIEFVVEAKIGTDQEGKPVTYYPGDTKTFPKKEADAFVNVGWAKCVESGEQGELKPGQVSLEVAANRTIV